MVDPSIDDEDGVDNEIALLTAGAKQDDGPAIEVAELGRAAPSVLETSGVLELVAEDERIRVLQPVGTPVGQ